jgi:hypothetical protein
MPLLEAEGTRPSIWAGDEIAPWRSHGGEPRHCGWGGILDRCGFSTADLACGADMPMHEPSARALIAAGKRPTALHNNCSGKHAGLLLACRLYGFAPAGYWKPRHPLQRLIRKRLGDFCGVPVARVGFAVDGCSLPVFHLPLSRLAFAYARLVAAPRPGESVRRRLCAAMWDSPGGGRPRRSRPSLCAGRGRWIGGSAEGGASSWRPEGGKAPARAFEGTAHARLRRCRADVLAGLAGCRPRVPAPPGLFARPAQRSRSHGRVDRGGRR